MNLLQKKFSLLAMAGILALGAAAVTDNAFARDGHYGPGHEQLMRGQHRDRGYDGPTYDHRDGRRHFEQNMDRQRDHFDRGRPGDDRKFDRRGGRPGDDRKFDRRGDRPGDERKFDRRNERPGDDKRFDRRGDRPGDERRFDRRGDRPGDERRFDRRNERPGDDRRFDRRGDRPGDEQGANRRD